MSKEINEVAKELWPINCFYNYAITKDDRCYSDKCMLNADEKIKKLIQEQGCNLYNQIAVQKYKEKEKH